MFYHSKARRKVFEISIKTFAVLTFKILHLFRGGGTFPNFKHKSESIMDVNIEKQNQHSNLPDLTGDYQQIIFMMSRRHSNSILRNWKLICANIVQFHYGLKFSSHFQDLGLAWFLGGICWRSCHGPKSAKREIVTIN